MKDTVNFSDNKRTPVHERNDSNVPFDQTLVPLDLGFMASGNRSDAVVSEVVLDRPPPRNDRDVVDVDGYRDIDAGVAVFMQQRF